MNDQYAYIIVRAKSDEIVAALHRSVFDNYLYDIREWSDRDIELLEKILNKLKSDVANLPTRSD